MSDNWIKVALVSDISADTNTVRVDCGSEAVCLYQVDGKVSATQDRCPHGNASLAEGYIEDGMIECPLHQALFDIATGEVKSPPCTTNLRTYPVKVEDGAVYIKEADS